MTLIFRRGKFTFQGRHNSRSRGHTTDCTCRRGRQGSRKLSQCSPENRSLSPNSPNNHRCGLLRVWRHCQLPEQLPKDTESYCSSHAGLHTSASNCGPISLPLISTGDHPDLKPYCAHNLPTVLSAPLVSICPLPSAPSLPAALGPSST